MTNSILNLSIKVSSKVAGAFIAQYDTVCSGGMRSMTIDSFGYMAVGCDYGKNVATLVLYNANNDSYLNLQLATSGSVSYFTAVDASGRLVSLSSSAIDIYY